MIILYHNELFEGHPVPFLYDLQYSPEDSCFYLSSLLALIQDPKLEAQIQRHTQSCKKDCPQLEETQFFRDPSALGFGKVFSGCEPLFPSVPSWKAIMPGCKEGNGAKKILDILATLSVLLYSLFCYSEYDVFNTNCCPELQQSMDVYLRCKWPTTAGTLTATLSPELRQMIEQNPEIVRETIFESLVRISLLLNPDLVSVKNLDEKRKNYLVKTKDNDGNSGLVIGYQGASGTGVYLDRDNMNEINKTTGWILCSSNINSPEQMLQLIAALATINRLYRENQQQT